MQLSAHLFRMAVLQDGPARGARDSGHDEQHVDFVDTRGAADRVHEGRRWLAGFLQLWRLVEVGAPPPAPLPGEDAAPRGAGEAAEW